jgi:membrane-bound ClpP family serine protease
MLYVIIAIVVLAILVAIAVHFGPHGSILSGLLGLVIGLTLAWAVRQSLSSGVAWSFVGGGIVVGAALGFIGVRGLRGLNVKAAIAAPTPLTRLLGEQATVERDLCPVGAVKIHGETWTASSESGERIEAGRSVFITRVDGLRLWVVPADEGRRDQAANQ